MLDWELRESFASEQGEIRWDVLGDGPPVVLVHGTPFSSYVWAEIARGLAAHHTVYVWDLAGYGSSEMADGQDVSLAAQARILAALLAHWELAAPAMVGHDFGGAVALRAHLLEGAVYDRLALVDAVSVTPWGTGFFQLAREHADVLQRLPDPLHDAMVRGYVTWPASHHLDGQVVDRLAAPWTGVTGRAALYRQIVQNDASMTDEIQPRYGDLDLPVLIVWGEDDAWLPLAQAHELHELIPGSRLVTIPEANHLIQFDAPARLTVELADFLAGG